MPSTPQSYLDGWQVRAQAEAQTAAAWRARVLARVDAVAEALVTEFGARGVVLFGSLARDEAGPGSDVDLLVEGLDPVRWLDAATRADALLGDVHADVVLAERARPTVLERARQEGRRLRGEP